MKFLKDPETLGKAGAAASVKMSSLWAVVVSLSVLWGLLWFLGVPLDFESPLYLVQHNIRVGLAGFPVALLRSLLTLTVGFAGVQWLENTEFGQRLKDNKGFVYAAIFIAVALAFSAK